MKKPLGILAGVVIALGLVFILHAQEAATAAGTDGGMDTALQALESVPPMPASGLPQDTHGFYSVQNPEWPPMPADVLGLNVWALGDGLFAVDDRSVNYDEVQAAMEAAGLVRPMGLGFTPLFMSDTNDLELEMLGVTNGVAALVIHPPWDSTNEVYDLRYCTNLDPPIAWLWLLRSEPGQTNLLVTNATDANGFYQVTSPNDLTADGSLGTNFWLAFSDVDWEEIGVIPNLSLYISSPVGATGTVTVPGTTNGPVLYVTNCGDAGLNGTYLLTNLTAQEQTDWVAGGLDATTNGYEYGTNWVDFHTDGSGNIYSVLFGYDGATHGITYLYYKENGFNLNGSSNDWDHYPEYDTNLPAPTTICPQIPLIIPFTVAAMAGTNISIPQWAMMLPYDVVETDGINVTSSAPVSVYGFYYLFQGTTAFTAYPVPLLGTNYCVLSRASADDYGTNDSQLAVVAAEDGTTVTIMPSATANLAGSYWTNSFTLQQGQTYQINSENGSGDVTGTWVESDKPVAVFAGDEVAEVPDGGTGAQNPLMQEQMPVEDWGTNVLALSFAGRANGDIYRVLAADNDTDIFTNGVAAGTKQAGQFLDLTNDGPVQFQASQPVQVAQFANGATFDNVTNIEGDPCEILLPPTSHYLLTNIVFSLPNGDFDTNYMNIIVAQSGIANTYLDVTNAITNFVAIGTSGYYCAQGAVTTNGTHTVTSSQPAEVQVYGFGSFDAYGYFGGVVK